MGTWPANNSSIVMLRTDGRTTGGAAGMVSGAGRAAGGGFGLARSAYL